MIIRTALSILLTVATALAISASPADARKKKYKVKPYPNTGVVRRTPPADFVPPKGANINSRPSQLILPNRDSACGRPPCAGGASSLGTRDIRNYQPGDIRRNSIR